MRKSYSFVLEGDGAQVTIMTSAQAALQVLKRVQPDTLLSKGYGNA